jgi:Protein of unknown function (DUF4235)
MAEKNADPDKEAISTRAFNMLTTMAAGFVARKALTVAWTKATGKEPPKDPEDPAVDLMEALAWAVLTGVTIAAIRVLAIRAVTHRTAISADREAATTADG